jgi:uncharacterized protein (TIGR02145 family)
VTFTGHRRGICPEGWHIPSDAEWTTLTEYVGANYACGGNSSNKAKALASETGWESYSGECYPGDQGTYANNASGFGAVPAGWFRSDFRDAGHFAYFWSATQHGSEYAYSRYLDYSYAVVDSGGDHKDSGSSVRCLKD